MEKQYAGSSALQIIINVCKKLFATKQGIDELTTKIAYLDPEDDETITEESPSVKVVVDSELSQTSINPIQNRVVTAQFDKINRALERLPITEDQEIDALVEADLFPAVTDNSGAILTDENGNVILKY